MVSRFISRSVEARDRRPIQILALFILGALLIAPLAFQYVNAALFGYSEQLAKDSLDVFDRQLPYVVGGLLTVIVGDVAGKLGVAAGKKQQAAESAAAAGDVVNVEGDYYADETQSASQGSGPAVVGESGKGYPSEGWQG